ncbi:MAG TPA: hypothetical protein VGB82_29305 [Alphaproteobacteria bacterium]
MIYLVAIFISPLALLLIGKWFQAILNLVLYVAAWILTLTIVFHAGGFICWALGVLHAVLAINSHRAERRHREMMSVLAAEKKL